MGQQINFWMAEDDEREFVERLASDDVVWSPKSLAYGETPVIAELADWSASTRESILIMARREDWAKLCHKHISESPLGLEKFTPWTMVGCTSSPCFEWTLCERDNNSIKRGRIYLATTWFSDGVTYNKDAELVKWFNRLVGWIKRRGTIGRFPKHYVLPHAKHLDSKSPIKFTT